MLITVLVLTTLGNQIPIKLFVLAPNRKVRGFFIDKKTPPINLGGVFVLLNHV